MKHKIISILLGAVMASSMAACNIMPQKVTAEELVEAMTEMDAENVNLTVTADIDADIDMEELGVDGTMAFAIEADFDLKSNKKYGSMEGDMSASIFGMNVNQDIEVYYDYKENTQYSYNETNKEWEKEEINSGGNVRETISDIDGFFEDLKLEKKKGKDYVVSATIDYEKVAEMSDMSKSLEGVGGSSDSFEDMEMDVLMTFSGKTKEIKKMEFSTDKVEDVDIKKFEIGIEFNQIGGDVDVKIPEKVLDNAKEKKIDSAFSQDALTDSVGMEDADSMDGEDDEWVAEEPSWDMEGKEDAGDTDMRQISSQLFGYEGKELKNGDAISTIMADGWTEIGMEPGIFVSMRNEKYPEATLYLYGRDSEITQKDLETDGVYGFDMDVTYAETNPEINFHGLGWGATKEDVIKALGNPKDSYSGNGYEVLQYKQEDGAEVEVTVYSENQFGIEGMTRVAVINYSIMD